MARTLKFQNPAGTIPLPSIDEERQSQYDVEYDKFFKEGEEKKDPTYALRRLKWLKENDRQGDTVDNYMKKKNLTFNNLSKTTTPSTQTSSSNATSSTTPAKAETQSSKTEPAKTTTETAEQKDIKERIAEADKRTQAASNTQPSTQSTTSRTLFKDGDERDVATTTEQMKSGNDKGTALITTGEQTRDGKDKRKGLRVDLAASEQALYDNPTLRNERFSDKNLIRRLGNIQNSDAIEGLDTSGNIYDKRYNTPIRESQAVTGVGKFFRKLLGQNSISKNDVRAAKQFGRTIGRDKVFVDNNESINQTTQSTNPIVIQTTPTVAPDVPHTINNPITNSEIRSDKGGYEYKQITSGGKSVIVYRKKGEGDDKWVMTNNADNDTFDNAKFGKGVIGRQAYLQDWWNKQANPTAKNPVTPLSPAEKATRLRKQLEEEAIKRQTEGNGYIQTLTKAYQAGRLNDEDYGRMIKGNLPFLKGASQAYSENGNTAFIPKKPRLVNNADRTGDSDAYTAFQGDEAMANGIRLKTWFNPITKKAQSMFPNLRTVTGSGNNATTKQIADMNEDRTFKTEGYKKGGRMLKFQFGGMSDTELKSAFKNKQKPTEIKTADKPKDITNKARSASVSNFDSLSENEKEAIKYDVASLVASGVDLFAPSVTGLVAGGIGAGANFAAERKRGKSLWDAGTSSAWDLGATALGAIPVIGEGAGYANLTKKAVKLFSNPTARMLLAGAAVSSGVAGGEEVYNKLKSVNFDFSKLDMNDAKIILNVANSIGGVSAATKGIKSGLGNTKQKQQFPDAPEVHQPTTPLAQTQKEPNEPGFMSRSWNKFQTWRKTPKTDVPVLEETDIVRRYNPLTFTKRNYMNLSTGIANKIKPDGFEASSFAFPNNRKMKYEGEEGEHRFVGYNKDKKYVIEKTMPDGTKSRYTIQKDQIDFDKLNQFKQGGEFKPRQLFSNGGLVEKK